MVHGMPNLVGSQRLGAHFQTPYAARTHFVGTVGCEIFLRSDFSSKGVLHHGLEGVCRWAASALAAINKSSGKSSVVFTTSVTRWECGSISRCVPAETVISVREMEKYVAARQP